MILQQLDVEGFRCFDASVTLELDPHRINILHGNNGTGKSSLFSALVRGLLDSHKVGGKAAAELCPWGTQLSPRITVVFEHNSQEYRVCKTFLRQKGTRLEVKEGRKFRPISNNEQADEKLRELLLAGAGGIGLARAEGWGLAQALWCAHDQLAIAKLHGPVLNSVREILGAQAMSQDSMKLIGAVKAKYLEYFNPSGKARSGKYAPVWVSKETDAIQLKQELADATAALETLQSAQTTAQERQRQCDEKGILRDEARVETEALSRSVAAYTLRERECKQRKAEWEAKSHETEAIVDRVNRVSELTQKLEQAVRSISSLSGTLVEAQAAESAASACEQDADRDFKQAHVANPEIEKCNVEDKEAEAYLADTVSIVHLTSTVNRARELQAATHNADLTIREMNAPASSVLIHLNQLDTERKTLETQLQSALLHLDLSPAADQKVSVRKGEPAGDHGVTSGETLHITGSPMIEVELPGFGSLRITGPSTSAVELRERLGKLSNEFAMIAAPYQTADLVLLDAHRQSANAHETTKRDSDVELRSLVRSETLENLESKRISVMKQVAAAEKRHSAWVEVPPDIDLIRSRRQTLDDTDKRYRTNATEAFTKAKDDLAASVKDRTAQENDLANARRIESDAQASLKQLRSDGLSDEDRERRRNTLAVEVIGLKEKYDDLCQALGNSAQNPSIQLRSGELNWQRLEQEFTVADGELNRQLGILTTLLDQAPYERQVQLEEKLEALETEIERDRLRSEALKLLYETVHACELEATEGAIEPVAQKAAEFLMKISGQSFSPVLDTNLAFENICTPKSGEPVSLELLSGGERQQAYLAVRLALADVLTRQAGKRELVVLDDVFTNTDEERIKRIFVILNEMREHAQFLILTCHPERYSNLRDVKRIDMEKLRAG